MLSAKEITYSLNACGLERDVPEVTHKCLAPSLKAIDTQSKSPKAKK